MGSSRGEFVKYPRTPHLFGSRGTADDKHLSEKESVRFLEDASLIVEEKIDGTNVGIHFTGEGKLMLQCRGHLISEGMHPQYDLFKQWGTVKRGAFEKWLEDRYILFGEWMYAKHSVHYRELPHYFFEFDLYDKIEEEFLSLERRQEFVTGIGVETVPVIHRGRIGREELEHLIGTSQFGSEFDNPTTGGKDNLMEGVYLRTESEGRVTGRAKMVRPEFIERVKQSEHWQHKAITPNQLRPGAEIWQ